MKTIEDLDEYQYYAVGHGLKWKSYAMFLDLGLGKTVCALTVLQQLLDRVEIYGALVVAPVRVCEAVWRQEAVQWAHTRDMTFSLVRGTPAQRRAALEAEAQVYLINYDLLAWLEGEYVVKRQRRIDGKRRTVWEIEEGKTLPFDMVVLDEISRTANPTSQRAKALLAFRLTGKIQRWMGLTATPATNGLPKLHGEYLMLDAGQRLGVTKDSFKRQYFYMDFDGRMKPFPGAKEAIFRRVRDITYAVESKGKLKIDKPRVVDVPVDLEDNMREAYEKLETEFFTRLPDGQEIEVFNAAAKTNKCLQFANGSVWDTPPEICPERDESLKKTWSPVHESKFAVLDELLEEAEGNQVIVCYPFKPDRWRMKDRYQGIYRIKDVQEYRDAAHLMADWNNGCLDVLTGHPASMGHGLNLQHVCNHMIWFGLVWDLELYDQAIGRLNRRGQTKPVIVHRLLVRDSLEHVVKDALSTKARTQTEFLDLLRDYTRRKSHDTSRKNARIPQGAAGQEGHPQRQSV